MKVITIVGARPQFIKAAVVSHSFREHKGIEEQIIHTGQHFDANMSDVFFAELGIPLPTYSLNIGGGTHGQNTGRMIEKIEEVLLKQRPDWVLVYGDTDSTLAGTLAAVKQHIPVAHVEAGLRSFNRRMPEEINRILTDHASDLLFTPTVVATNQLVKKEGVPSEKVRQVGDVMFDGALIYGDRAQAGSDILEKLKLEKECYVLATIHRAENTDHEERLTEILKGLAASRDPVIWPIHPRTRNRLAELNLSTASHVKLIEPVGYLDMVMLQRNARLIATDSGGVQKESYFHGTPCLTLRDETEWVELVELGVNRLVGASQAKIAEWINQDAGLESVSEELLASRPYGRGRASQAIRDHLLEAE